MISPCDRHGPHISISRIDRDNHQPGATQAAQNTFAGAGKHFMGASRYADRVASTGDTFDARLAGASTAACPNSSSTTTPINT